MDSGQLGRAMGPTGVWERDSQGREECLPTEHPPLTEAACLPLRLRGRPGDGLEARSVWHPNAGKRKGKAAVRVTI